MNYTGYRKCDENIVVRQKNLTLCRTTIIMVSDCEEVHTLAKIGRPKSDNPKLRKLAVRVSEKDYIKLKEYAAEHDLTITQVLQNGLELLYQSAESSSAKSLS